jgi:hypothetical protein
MFTMLSLAFSYFSLPNLADQRAAISLLINGILRAITSHSAITGTVAVQLNTFHVGYPQEQKRAQRGVVFPLKDINGLYTEYSE